jgi:hypothetical protein
MVGFTEIRVEQMRWGTQLLLNRSTYAIARVTSPGGNTLFFLLLFVVSYTRAYHIVDTT